MPVQITSLGNTKQDKFFLFWIGVLLSTSVLLLFSKMFYFFRTQTEEVKVLGSAVISAYLHYSIKKRQSAAAVRKILGWVELLVGVSSMDKRVIYRSLHSDSADFEVAIQNPTGTEGSIGYW